MPESGDRSELAARLDRIGKLTNELATCRRDSPRARQLTEMITREIDLLKRGVGASRVARLRRP